jgi:hypothetical protein
VEEENVGYFGRKAMSSDAFKNKKRREALINSYHEKSR